MSDGKAGVDLSDLIACPNCDALYRMPAIENGARARCLRCHTVLTAPHDTAMTRIVMLATTSFILMVAAVFFPFLELTAVGRTQRSSLLDVALVFADGPFLGLALAVGALVIFLPLLRLTAVLYVIGPMALGWRPARHARAVLRFDERIRPWAMSEVFIVGVAVALIKIAGLAHVSLGPAFWAFAVLVLINTYKDTFMCRLTLWKTLELRSA
ncbi:paraquat-inducible protein A [Tropicimonas sp. S265A]|uniref:paraquat-inducible protein A n=1 Tax=Tropicimonas sp. S265A TaxID=3415134 RepID=UPI003C7B982A